MACFENLDGFNASLTCRLGLQLCQCLMNPTETNHPVGYIGRGKPGLSKDTDDMLRLVSQHKKPSLSLSWNKRAKTARVRGAQDKALDRLQTPLDKKRALRPVIKDQHHQDSLFGNSFQSKSFFIVHPEWLSETVDNTDPEPLSRPPWPWEQPRYRQNVQLPITNKPEETSEEKEERGEGELNPQPLPYALPKGYAFTHPSIDETRPFEKNTQFGAPVVDTSSFKLSY